MLFLLACSTPEAPKPAPTPTELTILAASSLTESLQKVAEAYKANHAVTVTFSFDASSKLAKQIEAGVPGDVFFSADTDWMQYVDEKGLLIGGTRANLLGNSLVAVVQTGAPDVALAEALAEPRVKHLALAGENVPAGKYARAALQKLGVWSQVEARVVSGDNVRTTLGWVASGEAEVGVVYATDARVEPKVKVVFSFPSDSYPPIIYPAAVLKGSKVPEEAKKFLDFCASGSAERIFVEAGFVRLKN